MASDKPHQAVSNAEKAVQSTTERMARAAHDAIETAGSYGARAEERLRESAEVAVERGREYAEEFGAYIARRPIVSLGIALGIGLLVGALVRGRD